MLKKAFRRKMPTKLKNDFIFQQDNAPCHTTREVYDFFDKKGIKTLDWPSQSPDLSPIENVWGLIKQEIWSLDVEI